MDKIFKNEMTGSGFIFEVDKFNNIIIRNRVTEEYFILGDDDLKYFGKALECRKSTISEEKIDAHTKVSMDAYDKGINDLLQKIETHYFKGKYYFQEIQELANELKDAEDTKSEPKGCGIQWFKRGHTLPYFCSKNYLCPKCLNNTKEVTQK